MTTARFIITFACMRSCSYCCNEYDLVKEAMLPITDLDALKEYETVIITGGEPMLDPERTLRFIRGIKRRFPSTAILLYAAYSQEAWWEEILSEVDGVTYSLHSDYGVLDAEMFYAFQEALGDFQLDYPDQYGTYRLSVDGGLNTPLVITPSLWSEIKLKKWLTEEELSEQTDGRGAPIGEDLVVWRGEDGV